MTKLWNLLNQCWSSFATSPPPASGIAATQRPRGDQLVPGASWSKTTSRGSAITVRVASPADEAVMREFLATLNHDVVYTRFNTGGVSEVALRHILTNPGGVTLMALRFGKVVAFSEYYDSTPKGSNRRTCEAAVLVHQDHMRRGIGSTLMREVISIAKERGIEHVEGIMLESNDPIIRLAQKHSLKLQPYKDDSSFVRVEKPFWFSGLGRAGNERILSFLSEEERRKLIKADPIIARQLQEPAAAVAGETVATPTSKL